MTRSHNSLVRITSVTSLNSAWSELYRRSRPGSRNTKGIDGQSINDFALDPKANISRLTRDFREGQFHFQKLLPHFIRKPNGKERMICVPTVRDRVVQRALLDYISSKYQKSLSNKISYGFVKGRSVHEAATHARNIRRTHPWAYKTDITSFFDSIDRTRLESMIRSKIRESSFHATLIEAAHCEVDAEDERTAKHIERQGIRDGWGVRQGMPLSPLFSNLILQPFDTAVCKMGYRAVRYADDLIFFSNSRAECLQIDAVCRAELKKLGLAIPAIEEATKSMIYSPEDPAEFLGVGICRKGDSYELRLMPTQIEQIRKDLLDLSSMKELLARRVTLAGLGQILAAKIGGYMSAYEICTNIDELEKEITNVHQKVLRKIYRDELHIDLNALSAEARTFLGLKST